MSVVAPQACFAVRECGQRRRLFTKVPINIDKFPWLCTLMVLALSATAARWVLGSQRARVLLCHFRMGWRQNDCGGLLSWKAVRWLSLGSRWRGPHCCLRVPWVRRRPANAGPLL